MTYNNNNIFAKILRGEIPNVTLYEDEHCLAFMDIMPQSQGHCLVVPKEAAENLYDISPDMLAHAAKISQKLAIACKKAFDADGITIRQHNEAAGGQEVFHYHTHIIPRYDNVDLKPPASVMEEMDVLNANAERIKAAL